MIAYFFDRPRIIRRFHDGVLGVYMDRFAQLLRDRGYVRSTARCKLLVVEDLGWWLHRQGLGVDALDEGLTERFLQEGKFLGIGLLAYGRASFREFLTLLREIGATPPAQARHVDETALE